MTESRPSMYPTFSVEALDERGRAFYESGVQSGKIEQRKMVISEWSSNGYFTDIANILSTALLRLKAQQNGEEAVIPALETFEAYLGTRAEDERKYIRARTGEDRIMEFDDRVTRFNLARTGGDTEMLMDNLREIFQLVKAKSAHF